jgi:hypothetical protein
MTVAMRANLSVMQCASCGFAADSVSPSDAAVALRSYPRRYRAVLVRPSDDSVSADDVVRRAGADGWSALDHAAHLAVSLEAAAEALRLVSVQESPVVALAPERRDGGSDSDSVSVDDVLARVAAAAGAMAEEIGRVTGKDWDRAGRVDDGSTLSAIDIARHAVHEGVHHLRAAERAVEDALRLP